MKKTAEMAPPEGGLAADEKILILDFGSQYAQLIARRVREQQVYCEIVRHNITAARIRELAPKGVILSGGPASVYEAEAPKCDPEIFRLGIPVLGICYGMQLACDALGGQVTSAKAREYGRARLAIGGQSELVGRLAERNRSVDEPRRPGDGHERRFRAAGPHVDLPVCRRAACHAAGIRIAISSRGDAHTAGRSRAVEFSHQDLRLHGALAAGRFRRAGDRRRFAAASARPRSFAGCRAGSIRRWWPPCSIGPSGRSCRASWSTTACCARTKKSR